MPEHIYMVAVFDLAEQATKRRERRTRMSKVRHQ